MAPNINNFSSISSDGLSGENSGNLGSRQNVGNDSVKKTYRRKPGSKKNRGEKQFTSSIVNQSFDILYPVQPHQLGFGDFKFTALAATFIKSKHTGFKYTYANSLFNEQVITQIYRSMANKLPRADRGSIYKLEEYIDNVCLSLNILTFYNSVLYIKQNSHAKDTSSAIMLGKLNSIDSYENERKFGQLAEAISRLTLPLGVVNMETSFYKPSLPLVSLDFTRPVRIFVPVDYLGDWTVDLNDLSSLHLVASKMLARITSYNINEVSGLLAKISNWPLVDTSKCEVNQFAKGKHLDDYWRNFNTSTLDNGKVYTYNHVTSESESAEILLVSNNADINQFTVLKNYYSIEQIGLEASSISEPISLVDFDKDESKFTVSEEIAKPNYFPGTVIPAVMKEKGTYKVLGTIASLPSLTGEYSFREDIDSESYNYLDKLVSPKAGYLKRFSIFNNPGLVAYKLPIFAVKNALERFYKDHYFLNLTIFNPRATSVRKGISGLTGQGSQ